MEKIIERGLVASRWLLAPFYIGLIGAMALLMLKFLQELWDFADQAWSMRAPDAILSSLTLIGLALVANLVLTVMLAGYEHFVSKIDLGAGGKIDLSGLKMKLITSIIAIAG